MISFRMPDEDEYIRGGLDMPGRLQLHRNLHRLTMLALLLTTAGVSFTVSAQGRPDSAALIAAQREGMKPFAVVDGVWRGAAWTILPSGEKHNITQTERIGPFLQGSIKVIEGRGYNEDGSVGFNAFGIISYDPATKVYTCTRTRKDRLAISTSNQRLTATCGRFRRAR